jgi:hypothetical protein
MAIIQANQSLRRETKVFIREKANACSSKWAHIIVQDCQRFKVDAPSFWAWWLVKRVV